MELGTVRLRLRPFARHHLDVLHAHFAQPDVRRYLWDGLVVSRAEVRDVIDESIASFAERGIGLWLLEVRASAAVAGFAGLRPIPESADVELLYGLDRAHWGCGLATEASRAVLGRGFAVGVDPIWLRTDVPNAASIAVTERLGARYVRTDPEGAFGGTVVYALGREAAGRLGRGG